MFVTKAMLEKAKKFKNANKVILIQEDTIRELQISALWVLIENYADSKVSHAIAEDSGYGKLAIDAEVEYKKTRADMRGFLGLPEEN